MTNQIDVFLENWKQSAKTYYMSQLPLYVEMKKEWKTALDIHTAKWGCSVAVGLLSKEDLAEYRFSCETLKEPSRKFESIRSASECAIISDMHYAENRTKNNSANAVIEKVLTREVDRKKKQFIARVEKKAGKFTKTNLLKIGVDGSLNGFVKGEIKTVEVSTIYAGGYNIQCLHYRVLVK